MCLFFCLFLQLVTKKFTVGQNSLSSSDLTMLLPHCVRYSICRSSFTSSPVTIPFHHFVLSLHMSLMGNACAYQAPCQKKVLSGRGSSLMGPALYERGAKPSPSSLKGSTTSLVLSAPSWLRWAA